uniref:Probable rhamnogalacturonate lyase B n=1 Tax=Tanacetum cinerariifolium TaxID=118510 RepID=A0A6L2NN88_TANCI|nr:probable rhamnogalacturonate lyase B [Tanacetum cinerariifolium]
MLDEVAKWPYSFPASEDFKQAHGHGMISGRLFVYDSLSRNSLPSAISRKEQETHNIVLLEKLGYDGVVVCEWSGSALDEGRDEAAKWAHHYEQQGLLKIRRDSKRMKLDGASNKSDQTENCSRLEAYSFGVKRWSAGLRLCGVQRRGK